MAEVACFHRVGPKEDFQNPLEEILAFNGHISFDGAYESVWENRIELGKRRPIMFVQGGTLGSEGICTVKQLEDLRSAGFTIGWHGWSHRPLTELSDWQIWQELNPRDLYIVNINFFAYPHGDWDKRVAKLVKEWGYRRAYSTTQGEDDNDFAIPRIYI